MAESSKLDVRVQSLDRVYPAVAFTVLGNWIQEGRLLADDQVRPVGGQHWQRLIDHPLLAAYFPQPVAVQADDHAEAFEPVELGLGGRGESEDDDPDMIPLIDISLVLLVFFMMTAGSIVTASIVDTPPAENARVIQPGETIKVSLSSREGNVQYYFGDQPQPLTQQETLDLVAKAIEQGGLPEAVVKANPWIPYETVQKLLVGMETLGVRRIEAGVRDARAGEQTP